MSEIPQTHPESPTPSPESEPVVSHTTLHAEIKAQLAAKHCDEKLIKQIRRQLQTLHDAVTTTTIESDTPATTPATTPDSATDATAQPEGASASNDSAGATSDDAPGLELLDADMQKLRDKLNQEIAHRESDFSRIVDATDSLEQDVEAGKVTEAIKVRDDILAQLNKIPGLSERRRESIDVRLKAMEPRLKELRGWRQWGTTQAREQLIGDMEKLIGSKEHAKVIAQQVQAARETWKSWDKSTEGANKELWEKFDTTCTAAYEPCRLYFEQQEKERQANLQKRQGVVARLVEMHGATDWEAPDWRRLDKKLRDARTQWRQMGPVPGKQRKATDESFESAMQLFDAPMSAERNRSLRQRRDLIAQVIALGEETDIRQAVEAAKQAQQNWKPTVLSTNKQERELWQEFRTACDTVFVRRDEQRKVNDEKFKHIITERENICTQLEALLTDGESATSGRVKVLAQQWTDLDNLPRKLASKTDQRYRDLSTQLTTSKLTVQHDREEAKLSLLLNLAAVSETLEAALIDTAGAAPDANQAALNEAKSTWQTLAQDAQIATQVQTRFDNACLAASDANALDTLRTASTDSLTQRQDICLQLEIQAEIDSPGEFQRERMALQVNRLAQAMGGGQSSQRRGGQNAQSQSSSKADDKTSSDELVLSYLGLTTVPSEQRAALQQRFERANAALKSVRQQQIEKRVEQAKQRAKRQSEADNSGRGRGGQKPRNTRSGGRNSGQRQGQRDDRGGSRDNRNRGARPDKS